MKVLACIYLSLIQSTEAQGTSLFDLLLRASPVGKAVLFLLVLFSVVSWAIIFTKWMAFKRTEQATVGFLSVFRKRSRLSDVYTDSQSYKQSPLTRIFLAGYDEISNQLGENPRQIRSLDAVGRVLQSATIGEVTRLESSLVWLATAANASPFVGLFGTVVGIIIAFHGIGNASASTIQAVAPGIAEALATTAAGIAAAVPAAIFYNFFLNKLKIQTGTMDRFSLEMLNLVEKYYTDAVTRQA